ncbi:MAG: hypothetical protein LUQ25_07930 [Methanoregulaceae archaeon]|nr:hypothetical protein [Methanoregulaceae archaeon]
MEEKMRERARNAMRLILEAAKYVVEEVDEPLDLSAVKGDDCILVLCSDDENEIAQFDKTNYSLKINESELGCTKLLFSLDESIHTEHCIVWGVKEFVQFSGESVLADILDRQLQLTLSPARKSAGDTSQGQETEETSGVTIPHLPIKITKQNAERIAGIAGTGSLKFLPHWLFHYVSSGEQMYKEHRVPFDSEGWGALNAINGIKIEIKPENIEKSGISLNAEIVSPHITKEDASERITSELIERLTQRVRIKQVKGDAIYYEEKVVKPDKHNFDIDISEVYIPVWQIRGKKIVEINAFTGEILSVPMDEGVEIL